MITLLPPAVQAAMTPATLPESMTAATSPGAVTAAALPAPAPAAADVQKFEAAFSPPRVVIKGLDATPPPEVQPAIATPGALGDRVLASVERMRVGYQNGMTRIDATMHKENMRLPDVMSILVDTMQMSLQQDMLSKTVGRITQNLDTLLKGQ